MTDAILVLNAGSSSIMFSLFPGEQRPTRHDLFCEGECVGLGDRVHFTAKDDAGAPLLDEYLNQGATHEDALAAPLHWIGDRFPQHRRHRWVWLRWDASGDCMCAGPRAGTPACIRYRPGKVGRCASSYAKPQRRP